jgi:cytoskeletal protein CcmA (bactofilin family)
MFKRTHKSEKFKDAETVIGASIKVKGNFQGQGDIVIKGALEGSLKTDANIFIGDQARVVANIEAQQATINGEVRGNIKVKNSLSLGEAAKIFGDVQYGDISIERGAIINGQLVWLEDGQKKDSARKSEEKGSEIEK